MIFIDTANLQEIEKWVNMGVIKGCTTNPKILSKERKLNIHNHIRHILKIFDVCETKLESLSVEITNIYGSTNEIIEEAISYRRLDKRIVIKIPCFGDGRGFFLARKLLKEQVPINLTCMMSLNQGILACELGVTYASLFFNRMNDWSISSTYAGDTIAGLREIIEKQGFTTRIIAGSIRKPRDVYECFSTGAHIVTISPKILEQMPFHPKTEETIKEFDKAWSTFLKK